MHARAERQQRLFHTFSRKRTSDFWVATVERWDEHECMLVIHEQKCQELCQAIEQMGEREKLLVGMVERKILCKGKRQKNATKLGHTHIHTHQHLQYKHKNIHNYRDTY